MRSFEDSDGATIAVAKGREAPEDEGAEVIDLIQLPVGSRPRPFSDLEYEEVHRFRQLDCDGYTDCLSFAARVRWRGFSCRICARFAAPERLAVGGEGSTNRPSAAIIRLR